MGADFAFMMLLYGCGLRACVNASRVPLTVVRTIRLHTCIMYVGILSFLYESMTGRIFIYMVVVPGYPVLGYIILCRNVYYYGYAGILVSIQERT